MPPLQRHTLHLQVRELSTKSKVVKIERNTKKKALIFFWSCRYLNYSSKKFLTRLEYSSLCIRYDLACLAPLAIHRDFFDGLAL